VSPPLSPEQSCFKKIQYRTRKIARERVSIARRVDPRGHLLVAYKCNQCGAYHIGHRSDKKA